MEYPPEDSGFRYIPFRIYQVRDIYLCRNIVQSLVSLFQNLFELILTFQTTLSLGEMVILVMFLYNTYSSNFRFVAKLNFCILSLSDCKKVFVLVHDVCVK